MNRRTFLASTAGLVTASAGCLGAAVDTPDSQSTPDEVPLELVEHEYQTDPDAGVYGTLTNAGSESVEIATVTAKFYDENDVRFEKWSVDVEDIASDEQVAFVVSFPRTSGGEAVADYALLVELKEEDCGETATET